MLHEIDNKLQKLRHTLKRAYDKRYAVRQRTFVVYTVYPFPTSETEWWVLDKLQNKWVAKLLNRYKMREIVKEHLDKTN